MTNKPLPEFDPHQEIERLKVLLEEKDQLIAQQEKTLRDQELTFRLYHNVLNHIPLAMIILDSYGYIKSFNESLSLLLDFTEEKQKQHLHISRLMPFNDNLLGQKISKLLDDRVQFDLETRIPGLGDPDSYFRVRGISMRERVDNEPSYLIIIGNITKRREAEKNLILAKEKAEEANMLKTAFLSNLSHEIRTPLNHILGFLELLLMTDIPNEERIEYTTIVRNSSIILLKRIEDVINISKIETKQMDVHNDNLLVTSLLQRVHLEVKTLQNRQKNVDVPVVLADYPDYHNIIISADGRKVHQILINFLENALTFTQKGEIEIGFFIENKNGICFYVKDTGVGIDSKYHDSIFEHFRQVDNSPTREIGGSGLGLAIAKGMASLMNGNITLKSKPGKGSVFYLHLPESIISVEPTVEFSDTVEDRYNWSGKKILVADYELVNFNLIKVMLAKTNVEVSWIKTGEELIAEIYNQQPDGLIIDADLPGTPFNDFTATIKRRYPHIPMILMTLDNESSDLVAENKNNADFFLSKPIEKRKLLKSISSLFDS